MPLSEDQRQKLRKWLEEKKATPSCPSCGQNNWSLGEMVAALPFESGGVRIGGPTVPMVQLVCGNCAYVRFHAALPIGLIEQNPLSPT